MVALTIGCIVISYIPTDHNAVIKFISLTGYCTICPAAVMQSVPQQPGILCNDQSMKLKFN